MEPYCADITSEEVRTLEELLKPPEDEAEHYKVETLGFTVREQEGSEVPLNPRQQSRHHLLLPSQPSACCISPADTEAQLSQVVHAAVKSILSACLDPKSL